MPSSTPSHKFILDENVNRELYRFLTKNGLNVKLAPRSISDTRLSEISKKENRILVTNDEDFSEYTKEHVFSVIWLRVAQGNVGALIKSFDRLLKHFNNFSGRIIVLKVNGWEDFPLAQEQSL